jgi:hypothetical protein
MCWNAEISLSTFIFGIAAIAISYINGISDWKWSIFYLSIISMQLLEYFIWTRKDWNRILSILGFCIIILQPIAAGLLIANSTYQKIYYILYLLFICICIFRIFQLYPIHFSTTVGHNGHLKWKWLDISIVTVIIWTLFLLAAIYLSNSKSLFRELLVLFIIALVSISLYYYKKHGTWGSVYCSFVNIQFIFILAHAFYIQYNSRYNCFKI